MYSDRSIGVPKYKLEMSTVKYFTPGVDITELQSILIVEMSAVGELQSKRQELMSLPTVSLERSVSSVSGV
jgi:hypothetical protein